MMHKFSIFILFTAAIIHSAWGKDDFDYCRLCKRIEELRDNWPCNLCEDGMKLPIPTLTDTDVKETIPKQPGYRENNEISPKVRPTVIAVNHEEKKREDGRRTWLYIKIVISVILIIGTAILCHRRHMMMKRMGTVPSSREGTMQSFATLNCPPAPFLHLSSQNAYPPPNSHTDSYPALDPTFSLPGVVPPPPGFSYPPIKVPYLPPNAYPPPYTSSPQTQDSLPQTPKPQQPPNLLQNTPYPFPQVPYASPTVLYPLQQGAYSPPTFTSLSGSQNSPQAREQSESETQQCLHSSHQNFDSYYPQQASCPPVPDTETCGTRNENQERPSVSKPESADK